MAPTISVGKHPTLLPGCPEWASLSPDGSSTLTPPAETREGIWRVTVEARAPGGTTRYVVAEVDVQAATALEAKQHEIDPWCEVSLAPGMPGGVAVVTVDGGKPLPVGASVETARVPAAGRPG